MKIKSAEFEVSSPDLRSCPVWALPEFAFIGRSNVGKSSLINLLTERRELAMVSDLPGKTKLINFFLINGAWCLVDLPGYGFAHVGKQRRAEFNEAVADFLSKRRNLRMVYVLIDSRLPPQAIDLQFLEWLGGCTVPYALVFTKTDKQSASKTAQSIDVFKQALAKFRAELPVILSCSSTAKTGRGDILDHISGRLAQGGRTAG